MTLQVTAMPASLDETRADRSVHWLSPAAGLWVGTRAGDHAGMIERVDGAYHAKNGRGRTLGWYPDLDAAFAAIEGGEKPLFATRPGVRGMLWALNGAAAAAAALLAIALIR